MKVMRLWDSLTMVEQTLLRRAMAGYALAGTIQNYGAALRWAGAEDAPPPRNYTETEQRLLVPQFAATTLELAGRGLLTVHELQRLMSRPTDPVLADPELSEVLAAPENWLWNSGSTRHFSLSSPQTVRAHWFDHAFPVADTSGLPGWDELSVAQREILVCAAEASGMLTGPFGIWADPPADLDTSRRLAWVGRQLAPLLPFVRNGWIEVIHRPDERSNAFNVIPFQELHTALADPHIRYESQGDAWGVGVTCEFTYTGQAIWRGDWSSAWAERLNVD